ncbi:CHASE2 domain-containing protein [Actomonas aquatica]|uniref:Adenylate/guanylate cyclase domain-containing protein n=1 Tax=Actomonas aquatica TaxID=2866162 RepID=A0ABZ1C9F9_9BACT|nr:adenylate/guanylate cyclase domain-containing protein [Opitutus sp. WL0086]WRQ87219.1 adenylate/guanylate cyclase domain-containing protein [Opitutus sp. WL0086]
MFGVSSSSPRSRSFTPRRLALGVGLLILASVWLGTWSWIEALEGIAIDQRFSLRQKLLPEPAPPPVVVGLSDSSFTLAERAPESVAEDPILGEMAGNWPWNRRVYAAVVRRLRAAGARLIVFDIVFAGPNPGDADFAEALAEPGAPVVLASLWQVDHSLAGEGTAVLLEPSLPLLDAGAFNGFANVWPDPDGVLRHSESTLDAAALLGLPSDPAGIAPSLALAAARALDPSTPAMPHGRIDFRHPAADVPVVPIEDLFLPDRWNSAWLDHDNRFRDRVVWIGPLSEVRFKDVHLTPLGRMPGVQAQAAAFATFLDRRHPVEPPRWTTVALVSSLALIALLVTLRPRRASLQVTWAIAGLLLWVLLCFVAFAATNLVLPCVAPAGAWTGGAALGIGAQLVSEQRERRRLRRMLGRYVSEEIASLIADQPDAFSASLRGERRDVTVLFADLRGFTAWVEDAEPAAFVAQLNAYFAAIVDCVLTHGGTLQKYIGDAVLAVWGDTRSEGPVEDSARAVAAALAMQAALARLNAEWATIPDHPRLRMAIGLHHGAVMLGNVGHPRRMEFTVMGDAVNTASRLETANRPLDTDVLVSPRIVELLADRHRFLPVGPARLKGKRAALELFIPIGPLAAPSPPWWPAALRAHQAWQEGRTAEAGVAWAEAATAAAGAHDLRPYFTRRQQLCADAAPTAPLDLTAK